jgi:hypothetical protein
VKRFLLIFIFFLAIAPAFGQFAPAAGEAGSTAIHKDDVSFKGWAKSCKVTRGFINISDTTKTFSQNNITSNRTFFGSESFALGQPGGPLDCISLGDGGSAVLTFDFPAKNGPGADFAVFENGIKEQEAPFQYFLELAYVEVSTNGKRFVRFPAVSNTPAKDQILGFGQLDPTKIHNLAGKYVANYGTPFDLEDLKDSTGINLDSINYIRIIDVAGNIEPKFARYDSKGQVINDPFPTEFWTGGFDLDAVGLINVNRVISNDEAINMSLFKVYPNPVNSGEVVFIEGIDGSEVQLCSQMGKLLGDWKVSHQDPFTINIPELNFGMYFLTIRSSKSIQTIKLLVK